MINSNLLEIFHRSEYLKKWTSGKCFCIVNENKSKIIHESSIETSNQEKVVQAENETEENEKSNSETWIRVIMKESTEVNGVRFPEGIQIDVTEEDSKKLIESGKAAIIS